MKDSNFLKRIAGKLFADKGYISQELVKNLFIDGIQLITGIRNNMKNQIMSMYDKVMLRKRSIIETVNDELKNICQIEHSRHRSLSNFLMNLISGLLAYSFLPKKPGIKYESAPESAQIALFHEITYLELRLKGGYHIKTEDATHYGIFICLDVLCAC